MNFSIIIYILGWVLKFEGIFFILPCLVALIYSEKSGFAFLFTMLLCLILGFLITKRKVTNKVFYAREGFVTVALSWILLSVMGALPFTLSGEIPLFHNALFETISGFTTTGASILTDIEGLSKCSLMWRSFTHWIGGMGVLVFLLAVLPMAGGDSLHLMKAESPGPQVGKLVPRIRSTAIILYGIYIIITLVQIVLLLIGKMPLFDALTISFGTAGTGGFAIKNDSITGYSTYLQGVVTVFMILFGINFNVYYLFLIKKPKQALKCEELKYYLMLIFASIFIITLYIWNSYGSLFKAFHHAAFQVASIITTTGYCTADFNLWPEVPKTILIMLMFVGACAGSTGGGIKVSRIIILLKTIKKEIVSFIHPRSVKRIRFEGRVLEQNIVSSVAVFIAAYAVIYVFSVFIISFDNFDFTTNFTAVAATMNNIGPGLNEVGPAANFSDFGIVSKIVLMFDMLAGRLELYPMLLILAPATWRK